VREWFQGGSDVAGEEPAVSGQSEPLVWSGAQEFGADDGLELADLAGEEGVPAAEPACCALEAGLPGDRQESPDALLGTRVGENVPDVATSAKPCEWRARIPNWRRGTTRHERGRASAGSAGPDSTS
jgi:hypothetical protein